MTTGMTFHDEPHPDASGQPAPRKSHWLRPYIAPFIFALGMVAGAFNVEIYSHRYARENRATVNGTVEDIAPPTFFGGREVWISGYTEPIYVPASAWDETVARRSEVEMKIVGRPFGKYPKCVLMNDGVP